MILALTIIHVVIAVVLIVVVLMQHGKQQGLSGAIAGGAETFFGKNKGRTIDSMLKKFTSVFAVLFIISSLALTAVSVADYNKSNASDDTAQTDTAEGTDGATGADGTGDAMQVTMDENGNLVDADGNVVMTAEQMAEQQAAQEAEGTDAAATEGEPDAAADANNAEATPDDTADNAAADNAGNDAAAE